MSGASDTAPYSVKAKKNAKPITERAPAKKAAGKKSSRRHERDDDKQTETSVEPYITFDEGVPFAVVHGGEHDKQIVCVSDTEGDPYAGADPVLLLGEDFFQGKKRRDGKRLNFYDMDELSCALRDKDGKDLDDRLLDIFAEAMEFFENRNLRELAINEGFLSPLPDCERRECIYIAGPSGSGKSTWTARWINEFRKLVPDVRFVLFSRVKEDKILDLLKPERIMIDDDMVKTPIEPETLSDAIVVFDDCDTIPSDKQKKAVNKLRDDLLETGRHHNVWVLSTAHQLTNYSKTRVILNEATKMTVFPRSGSSYHIRRVLREYFGFNKGNIDKVLRLPSRWVTITRTAPQLVLHEKGAYLVGD